MKSCKYHLICVVGNANLTYEQMYTILYQVESTLNSRPLTALSNDPNDLSPLTPTHFLVDDTLTVVPEPQQDENINLNRVKLYQPLRLFFQHFWKRWVNEYLTSSDVEQKSKWKFDRGSSLQIGSLVVLRGENIPVLQWKLGRVTGQGWPSSCRECKNDKWRV